MRYRYVSRVLYDGTTFKGWQDQDDKSVRTVQSILSWKISKRLNCNLKVTGASRTDMNVHANGQVIHFDSPSLIDIQHFEYSMNRILPNDIRLFNVTSAPLGNSEQIKNNEPFHATKSSIGKLYSYRFCVNKFLYPNRRRYYGHVYQPLDLELFKEALSFFVGTHDFAAFTNRVEHTTKDFDDKFIDYSTIRTIYSINLRHEEEQFMKLNYDTTIANPLSSLISNANKNSFEGYYAVDFMLKSATYRMIRNIVGTCLEVGYGRFPIEYIPCLLNERLSRNDNKARPAVPEGLTLEHVFYDHY